MTDRSHARLLVLAVLILSLVVTLAARAFSLQVLDPQPAAAAAEANRLRDVVIPAARGMVLDQQGRTLATNRISLDVAIARRDLRRLDDDGQAVLGALADLLDIDAPRLAARLQNCGTSGAQPRPDCWNGAPGANPVVVRDVGIEAAGAIMADPQSYPAVSIIESPVRDYPGNALAAHTVGHVAAVTADDLAEDPELDGIPVRGRAGLEQVYDAALRGTPGREQAEVDSAGHRTGATVLEPAQPGLTLVTNIDAQLQAVVEKQLQAAIERGRGRIDPISKKPYEGDGGAAVVLDVRTGAVLALASAPGFDANVWADGVAADDYATLTDPAAGQPLLNRAVQSALAPASTFKVVSTAAALRAGYSTTATYPCPSEYVVGGRAFQNYKSRSHGAISLQRALEVSCDTIYYRLAHEQWQADGGSTPVQEPTDLIAGTAADFGFGRPTGIDLPGETAGRIASRQFKATQWEAERAEWCRRAAEGYPEVVDPQRAKYLTKLAAENCTEGMLWRVGDALNASIGQGDTTASVLQLASAYAAIANGGTLYRPQVARALLRADGSVHTRIPAEATSTLGLPEADLAFLRAALRGVIEDGSARRPFAGFPVDEVPLAGKTGTGEVYGSQATSWFASFAPADDPRYAVVIMVSQGGTGAGTSGASIRGIYEALFGVRDGAADPSRGVLVGGDVATELPTVGDDGVPQPPGGPTSDVPTPGGPDSGVPAPAVPTPGGPDSGVPAPAVPTPGGPTPDVPDSGVRAPAEPSEPASQVATR